MTPEEHKAQIEELIVRYETQLKLPFVKNAYYKSEQIWKEKILLKIKELKAKLK